jgi:hypothetical protein
MYVDLILSPLPSADKEYAQYVVLVVNFEGAVSCQLACNFEAHPLLT